MEQTTAITIMHVLNRIISSDTASNQHKTKACFILCEEFLTRSFGNKCSFYMRYYRLPRDRSQALLSARI